MSAAAVGREEVHYLVHLLSAAALIWFALHSLHVRHPTELLWAVSARRNASSASAEAVLTLTQHAPACRGSMHLQCDAWHPCPGQSY